MKIQGNILVLTSWSYKDALVQTYTLPYLDIIRSILPSPCSITLVTDEQGELALTKMEAEQINKEWAKRNMELIPQPYQHFGLRKMLYTLGRIFMLTRVIRKKKISVIHAFCTPIGAEGYLLSRLTGSKLIIDSYEPHAESMVENGTWKKGGLAFTILFTLEKWQSKRAYCLIGTTNGMKEYAANKYHITIKHFFSKPACVDLDAFSFKQTKALVGDFFSEWGDDKIVCVYAGKLGGIYYRDEVFDFIRACYERWQDRFRFLMLTNAPENEIKEQLNRTGLPAHMIVSRFVAHEEVPAYLAMGDFAINPVKPVPSKRYCTSIKDGEYWAMGLPVVISPAISDDSAIIEAEKAGVVIDFSDVTTFPPALDQLEKLLQQASS